MQKPLLSSPGPPRSTAPESSGKDDGIRIFVALFDYDPVSMSPNPDAAEEELPFKEGQILKVCGDKDADGFYRGECAGREGYIPCNMVSEVPVESSELKQQLLKQGFLPADTESPGTVCVCALLCGSLLQCGKLSPAVVCGYCSHQTHREGCPGSAA